MKLLFLANRVPYPPYRGDKLKIYNLAKRLAARHELHLVAFAQTRQELEYKAELEKIFTSVTLTLLPRWKSMLNCVAAFWKDLPLQVLYFHCNAMKEKLREVLAQHHFDAVHVQHLRMSPYLAGHKELPRILDLPDAFSLYWQRRMDAQRNPLKRWAIEIEQRRVMQYEGEVIPQYNLALACSPEDIQYLKSKHNLRNLKLLPNGVDLDIFAPQHHDYGHNHTLLFTGNMDYAPNVDAVTYFATDILPRIRQLVPEVKFVIAGQRPVKKIQELANDHIIVTGFIQDLASEYNKASVVVAPLRFGAGTQNKVLEAMAMGVPVVCTNIGFAGLGIQSGEGAIMQADPDAFANSVIQLLQSADMRRKVGTQGQQVIHSRFGWDAIARQLEQYFTEIQR